MVLVLEDRRKREVPCRVNLSVLEVTRDRRQHGGHRLAKGANVERVLG